MPANQHKPEEIIGKLRGVEIVLDQGGTTAEACWRIAVSEQTYYRWRKEYGGLNTDQARRSVRCAAGGREIRGPCQDQARVRAPE